MDTEVSSALSTLELDPRNKDARAAIIRHTETGDVDRDKLASALSAARALPRRTRQRRAAAWSCCDRELAVTDRQAGARRPAGREGPAAVPRVRPRRAGGRDTCARRWSWCRATPPPASCCARSRTRRRSGRRPPRPGSSRPRTWRAKPAAAPHFAVAGELYLKYRPTRQRGRDPPGPGAWRSIPGRSGPSCCSSGCTGPAAASTIWPSCTSAGSAAAINNDERAAAEVLAGEVALEQGKDGEALEHFKRALAASAGRAAGAAPGGGRSWPREENWSRAGQGLRERPARAASAARASWRCWCRWPPSPGASSTTWIRPSCTSGASARPSRPTRR